AYAEGRTQKGLQNLFQRRLSRPLTRVEQFESLPSDRFEAPQNHGVKESFLGSIVIVDGSQVHLCVGDDGSQRRAGKAIFREQALGRIKNSLFGVELYCSGIHTNDLIIRMNHNSSR